MKILVYTKTLGPATNTCTNVLGLYYSVLKFPEDSIPVPKYVAV
jgi:hypothetical protein